MGVSLLAPARPALADSTKARPGATSVGFITHNGDTKDQGDRAVNPAVNGEIWLTEGDAGVYGSRAAAQGYATIHYHRADGNYDGWGLHVWSGAATATSWDAPLQPAGKDAFGVYFRVPLAAGATSLSYIIHNGDTKDLADNQSLDLTTYGNEVWIQAATAGYLLPEIGASAPDADLTKAKAQLIDGRTLAWKLNASASKHYALVYSPSADLAVKDNDLGGDVHIIRLNLVSGGLTAAQLATYPNLAGYAAFSVDPRDVARVKTALRSQLIATERGPDGGLLTATGVQIPGALDDLYATAAKAQLGPVWDHGTPTLSVWAPTAQKVALELSGTTVPMHRDDTTGVWSVRGRPSWRNKPYLYAVTVYAPTVQKIVTNEVTDPYSLGLTADSVRSLVIDLSDPALRPAGWAGLRKPRAIAQNSIYELQVRDFSASDQTVPAALRGTYAAFTQRNSAGMRALRSLAQDGLTHVHLLPVFDFSSVPELKSEQSAPACDLTSYPADSSEQQACLTAVKDKDAYNWGYDPLHYTTPEGSYSTDPNGTARIKEFREMVQSINGTGLRVVMDVVYNHTVAAGQAAGSVLDKIVPGYYQRLLDDGTVATSTCCANTAPEHLMMGKLVVDSIVTWAKQYKVDGFRFDLMGFHPKTNILAVRKALDALTLSRDGVDGKSIILYGEGWNFGEVANDARFVQATQANLAGTGVGTFNDRLRDAVRGGSPFDSDPGIQGFGSGLYVTANSSTANGTSAEQKARLLTYTDQIEVGLAGNLKDYTFTSSAGTTVTGAQIDYGGAPTGYTAAPDEAVTYVDAHDNETLFDALAYKLPQATTMADRARMQTLSLAFPILSQGTAFFQAGTERLRSKSLDRNSYDSGDWFNRLLWDCSQGNGFGSGLAPAADNAAYWPYAKPLLASSGLRPGCTDITSTAARTGDLLKIRRSSPLFALGTASEVQKRLSFPLSGSGEVPGVVLMHLDGTGLDPRWKSITVIFNADTGAHHQLLASMKGAKVTLHPVQATSPDPVVKQSSFDPATGTFTVPGRTVAVFVQT